MNINYCILLLSVFHISITHSMTNVLHTLHNKVVPTNKRNKEKFTPHQPTPTTNGNSQIISTITSDPVPNWGMLPSGSPFAFKNPKAMIFTKSENKQLDISQVTMNQLLAIENNDNKVVDKIIPLIAQDKKLFIRLLRAADFVDISPEKMCFFITWQRNMDIRIANMQKISMEKTSWSKTF